jgi:hypothetical protein
MEEETKEGKKSLNAKQKKKMNEASNPTMFFIQHPV